MLSRKYRATRTEIERVIKSGITISGDFFYAKVSKDEKEKPGFAIIISKKIEKTSSGRHLLKRKISSVIEKKILKAKAKKIAVFFPKKIERKISYKKIDRDVSFILERAGF